MLVWICITGSEANLGLLGQVSRPVVHWRDPPWEQVENSLTSLVRQMRWDKTVTIDVLLRYSRKMSCCRAYASLVDSTECWGSAASLQYSLTGSVGQLFDSCLGQQSKSSSGGLSHLNMAPDFLQRILGLPELKGSPKVLPVGILTACIVNENWFFLIWCGCLNILPKQEFFV